MINRNTEKNIVLLLPILLVGLFFEETAVAKDSVLTDATKISAQCESTNWNKAKLLELKANQFTLDDEQQRNALALQLQNCLANPDPVLRDGVAYEAFSTWLRQEKLSKQTMTQTFENLSKIIANPINDPDGIYKPFAALVMSELIRSDSKNQYLTEAQIAAIVNAISDYMTELTDYRGFDDQSGWRHGVAHSADVMLHLAMNPRVNKNQLNQLLTALQKKITLVQNHSYIFGEPRRIAIASIYNFLREEQSIEYWENWLSQITNPAPLSQWSDAYQSESGLTKMHNTQQFLFAFYALIKSSQNEKLQQMVPALEAALKQVH